MSITLHHGDCLEVMPSIPDASVDMVLCDLPYGTTACKWDVVIPFAPLWEQYRRVVKRNGAVVLFGSQPFTSLLVASNLPMFRYEWVWAKDKASNYLNAKKQPLRKHENIVVFYRQQTTYNPQKTYAALARKRTRRENRNEAVIGKGLTDGYVVWQDHTRYPVSVVEFGINWQQSFHPTQKPVALCEYLIRTYTNDGDTVLDNTMGSGTTGVACVNTGRAFVGIERDAGYFAIAEKRIEAARVAPRQMELIA